VLAAEHELIPVIGHFCEKALHGFGEAGPQTGVIFQDEERINVVHESPLEYLPVGLHTAPGAPGPAARFPSPRRGHFAAPAIDCLKNLRFSEGPVLPGQFGAKRRQAFGTAFQTDDNDAIKPVDQL
jgi:hypothetical protein